eukprot:10447370-Alexandrium_andersonii.AAC.1
MLRTACSGAPDRACKATPGKGHAVEPPRGHAADSGRHAAELHRNAAMRFPERACSGAPD